MIDNNGNNENNVNLNSNQNAEYSQYNSNNLINNVPLNNNDQIQSSISNNNLSNKNGKQKGKIIIIVLLICMLLIGCTFILFKYVLKFENGSIVSKSDSEANVIKMDWKIILKGNEYKLPVNLKKITDAGFYYSDFNNKSFAETNKEEFTTSFSLNPEGITKLDKEYVELPDAGLSSFEPSLELYLIPQNGNSDKYGDYLVAGFSVNNVSKEFFSVNGVGCGSSLEEIIKALKIDINKNGVSYKKDSYLEFIDTEKNIAITAYKSMWDESVFNFSIFINNRDYLKNKNS